MGWTHLASLLRQLLEMVILSIRNATFVSICIRNAIRLWSLKHACTSFELITTTLHAANLLGLARNFSLACSFLVLHFRSPWQNEDVAVCLWSLSCLSPIGVYGLRDFSHWAIGWTRTIVVTTSSSMYVA